MKPPDNSQYLLFGGTFVLANKLQVVGDKAVHGLSTKQWFLLRNLMDFRHKPYPMITQIAEVMNSTRQNITKMLESMERQGFVVVEKSEKDHRRRSVRITSMGIDYAEQTAANAQGFLDKLFQGIEEDEQDTAGKVLLKMMANLEKIQENLP